MNALPSGLTELGFWVAVAVIVAALIWAGVRKHQMKHEFTLKLLEKGDALDREVVEKLLAAHSTHIQHKSQAEQDRAGGYFVGFLFLVAGVALFVVGILSLQGPRPMHVFRAGEGWVFQTPPAPAGGEFAWALWMGLAVFVFAFGLFCWARSEKRYRRAKAEEKLPQD